jgi:hypothetical protein
VNDYEENNPKLQKLCRGFNLHVIDPSTFVVVVVVDKDPSSSLIQPFFLKTNGVVFDKKKSVDLLESNFFGPPFFPLRHKPQTVDQASRRVKL